MAEQDQADDPTLRVESRAPTEPDRAPAHSSTFADLLDSGADACPLCGRPFDGTNAIYCRDCLDLARATTTERSA